MAKQSGLGDAFYLGGYDISSDTSALGEIGGGCAILDTTGIDKSAFERIGGVRDGRIEWTSHFNPAAAKQHDVLSTLPTDDRHLTYCRGTSLGSPAACLVAKQLNYDVTRADDGRMTIAVRAESNGYGLQWGHQATAGTRTDTAATNGTGFSLGGLDYLNLTGASGTYASTPDTADLDITGDLDIRAKVSLTDWTPAAESTIVAKYTATGNQRSYALAVTSGGNLILRWSANGTAELSETSSVAVGATDGTAVWVRATLDVDNGASDAAVVFYTSADGTEWTQLGTTQLNGGATTSVFASTAVLELGGQTLGTVNRLTGRIYEALVLSGIGGTVVAHPVPTLAGITDATSRTWTLNGAASLTTGSSYGLQAYLQVTAFTGTDATIKLQESSDNGGADAWADITGGAFASVTTGPQAQRIATSSSLAVERYVRAVTTTTGGFTQLSFNLVVVRNVTATAF